MKPILLLCLFGAVASCQKQADPVPPTPTPQQLLLGTWKQVKYVQMQRQLDGRIILHDSMVYATPDATSGITYLANGTTSSPAGPSGDYVFTPPTLTFSYRGYPTGTVAVLTLTKKELVTHSKIETNTSVITQTHFYVK